MSSTGRAGVLALAAAVAVLAVASSSALASTFTLSLSLPSKGIVNEAMNVTATGNDPSNPGGLYLEIDAIPTTEAPLCPSDFMSARNLASSSSNGQYISFMQPEHLDTSANFSIVNMFTPIATGAYLICAYSDDGVSGTLATASMTTTITTAPPPVKKPVNATRPLVTGSGGRLSCSRGVWANAPVRYFYGWLVAGRLEKGAHRSTLGPVRELLGRRVRCIVTASNSAGSASATSALFSAH